MKKNAGRPLIVRGARENNLQNLDVEIHGKDWLLSPVSADQASPHWLIKLFAGRDSGALSRA